MSETLIYQEEFNGEVLLNTFFGGTKRGICSQLTILNNNAEEHGAYTQMELKDMIAFFKKGLVKLKEIKMRTNGTHNKKRFRQ